MSFCAHRLPFQCPLGLAVKWLNMGGSEESAEREHLKRKRGQTVRTLTALQAQIYGSFKKKKTTDYSCTRRKNTQTPLNPVWQIIQKQDSITKTSNLSFSLFSWSKHDFASRCESDCVSCDGLETNEELHVTALNVTSILREQQRLTLHHKPCFFLI